MRKFEYDWDTLDNYIGIVAHREFLDQRSNDGWELVSTVLIEVGSSERLRFYWKREIQINTD